MPECEGIVPRLGRKRSYSPMLQRTSVEHFLPTTISQQSKLEISFGWIKQAEHSGVLHQAMMIAIVRVHCSLCSRLPNIAAS